MYQCHWGHGRTMFMALMAALWKRSELVVSDCLKDIKRDYNNAHPFSYCTIDHPSASKEELDDSMIDSELSEEELDKFLLNLPNDSGYMIFYHDIYETDELYANEQYRLTMKQKTDQEDKLVKIVPIEYMDQYSTCTSNFIETWQSFAKYWEIKTE